MLTLHGHSSPAGAGVPGLATHSGVFIPWEQLPHSTATLAHRGNEGQDRGKAEKKNNLFWGKKSMFLGLHQKELPFTALQGRVAASLLVRQNFLQFC